VERSSYDEVCRALSVLGTRKGRREIYVKITARAGYDLLPAASWLLLRIRRYGWAEPAVLAERSAVPLHVVIAAARQVEERRLARRRASTSYSPSGAHEVAEKCWPRPVRSPCRAPGRLVGPGPADGPGRLVKELNAEMCGSNAERPHNGTVPKPAGRVWLTK
jgi:hypothetical protein